MDNSIIGSIVTLFVGLFSGVTILDIYNKIKYSKQETKMKNSEVLEAHLENEAKRLQIDNAGTDNDEKQIDLGQKFVSESLKQIADVKEFMQKINTESNENVAKQNSLILTILEKIDKMREDISELREEQQLERKFLNGEYAEFRRKEKEQNGK